MGSIGSILAIGPQIMYRHPDHITDVNNVVKVKGFSINHDYTMTKKDFQYLSCILKMLSDNIHHQVTRKNNEEVSFEDKCYLFLRTRNALNYFNKTLLMAIQDIRNRNNDNHVIKQLDMFKNMVEKCINWKLKRGEKIKHLSEQSRKKIYEVLKKTMIVYDIIADCNIIVFDLKPVNTKKTRSVLKKYYDKHHPNLLRTHLTF